MPKPRLATILAVALGGAIGATARVVLPWPTMLDTSLNVIDPIPIVIINLIGAALLGLFTGYATIRPWPEPLVKGITTGFFGAFTTMSALAVVYSGLTVGQNIFATASILHDVLYAAAIAVGLVAFLYLTTLITIGAIKLGTRLAGSNT